MDLLVEYMVEIIDLLTVLIIFFGFSYAIVLFVFHHTHRRWKRPTWSVSLHRIRVVLGEYLLVALELFICADVILSVKDPSVEHLTQLGVIVLIRIMIAYFLQRELAHISEK